MNGPHRHAQLKAKAKPATADLALAYEGLDGHRREVLQQAKRLARAHGLSVTEGPLRWSALLSPAPIVSLMLEDHPAKLMLMAAIRGLFGLRTVAFMFRTREALDGRSVRLRLKRVVLKAVRRLPTVSILTLFPADLEPSFSSISAGGIYDPQLWDLQSLTSDPTQLIVARAVELAGGRIPVISFGEQSTDKGFDQFVALWTSNAQIRSTYLFIAAGRVSPPSREAALRFSEAGGMLIDRFVEDDELLGLYAIAGLVWACYGPDYDQASGIFGRAVQIGRPAVVRQGALIERLADHLGAEFVALPWGAPDAWPDRLFAASARASSLGVDARALTDRLKRVSLATIGTAIGRPCAC